MIDSQIIHFYLSNLESSIIIKLSANRLTLELFWCIKAEAVILIVSDWLFFFWRNSIEFIKAESLT